MGKNLAMTTAPFVHLHVHSDYSPMRGVSSLEELCVSAQRQGMPAMGLTDTNGLYGAIRQKSPRCGPFLPGSLDMDERMCGSTPAVNDEQRQRIAILRAGQSIGSVRA